MKKLFSIVSAILCTAFLTMTFSAATEDAYTLYKRSVKKMDSVSSFELKTTTKLYVGMYGAEFEATNQTINVKVMFLSKKNMAFEAHSQNRKIDPMDAYYKDGYLYRDYEGKKQKIKMNAASALAVVANTGWSTYDEENWDMVKKQMEGATVERVEGGYRIRYKTDIDDLLAAGGMTSKSLIDSLGLPSGTTMRMSNISNTMTIGDDDYQTGYATAYSISLVSGNETTKVRHNGSGKISGINSVKKINYPADLTSYVSVKSL